MKKANRTNRAKKVFTPRERLENWSKSQKHIYTESPMEYPKIQIDTTDNINADTLYNKAVAITARAILTDFSKSGNEKMRKLYFSCIAYANGFTDDGEGGADLVQETVMYLWQYNGQKLNDTTGDGQKDKNGNDITILRGAFRNIAKLIKRQAREELRRVYIDDYERGHGQISVNPELHIDDFETFTDINRMIQEMGLTAVEKSVLECRLRGMSTYAVAEKRGTSQRAVAKTLKGIQRKYATIHGVPVNVNTD